MKKVKDRSYDYSPIALRNKARIPMPPPSFRMRDKKRMAAKNFCRAKEH